MRHGAAKMIQKNYRGYRRWNVIPKIMRRRKYNAAETIQKIMRGFKVRVAMYRNIQDNKLNNNFNYFG